MKKFLCLCFGILLLTSGCGKKEVGDVIKEFTNTVHNSKSYILKGTMEIYSDEDTFTYSVEANYLKDNFYKVILVNQTNNHEQIILRNLDGVYVITPSLNKSFKFQSEWPDNSSQSYLLKAIVTDMENDAESTLEEMDGKYVIRSKVHYPNNSDLVYQKVTVDDHYKMNKVEVYNGSDMLKIKMTVATIDMKAGLSEEDFQLEDYVQEDVNSSNNSQNSSCQDGQNCEQKKCNDSSENCKQDKTTGVLEDIIYPLYIPSNTYLSGKDKVDTDNGERIILTFGGDKSFVLVEEVATVSNEFEIVPVYGDPLMLNDTVAALSENSLYWTSNNISYYLAGNDLTQEEILNIAKNMNNSTSVVHEVSGEK